MKIITLNLAGRKDFDSRFGKVIDFLNSENADIVCLQEVTFDEKYSLADKINDNLQKPFISVQSDLAEKYQKNGQTQTDGLAILAKFKIDSAKVSTLTKVPTDKNGRPDFHKRIFQEVYLENGLTIVNTHLASNNNSHLQFRELIKVVPEDAILTGDFNLPRLKMLAERQLWENDYNCSVDFSDYISFPSENQTFDYLMFPKTNKTNEFYIAKGVSDHNALICNFE